MGQRLYVVKGVSEQLKFSSPTEENYCSIIDGSVSCNYRLCIKNKINDVAVEYFDAVVVGRHLAFDVCSSLDFGTYIYEVQLINLTGTNLKTLGYGYIEVMPDLDNI